MSDNVPVFMNPKGLRERLEIGWLCQLALQGCLPESASSKVPRADPGSVSDRGMNTLLCDVH